MLYTFSFTLIALFIRVYQLSCAFTGFLVIRVTPDNFSHSVHILSLHILNKVNNLSILDRFPRNIPIDKYVKPGVNYWFSSNFCRSDGHLTTLTSRSIAIDCERSSF